MASNTTPPIIIPVILDSSQIEKGMSEINRELRKGIQPINRGGGGNGIGTGGGAGSFGSGGGEAIAGVALGAAARGKRTQDTYDNSVHKSTIKNTLERKMQMAAQYAAQAQRQVVTTAERLTPLLPGMSPYRQPNAGATPGATLPFAPDEAMERFILANRFREASAKATIDDIVNQNAINGAATPRVMDALPSRNNRAFQKQVKANAMPGKYQKAATTMLSQASKIPGLATIANAGPVGLGIAAAGAGLVGPGMITDMTANIDLNAFRNQDSASYNTAATMRREAYSRQTAGPIDNFLVGMGAGNGVSKGLEVVDKISDSLMRGAGNIFANYNPFVWANGKALGLLDSMIYGEAEDAKRLDAAKRAQS
jgi:hypothetical protein